MSVELEDKKAKFEEDIKASDWSLKWSPDDELVWMHRGKIFWGVQRYEDAIDAFSQGITRCTHYGPLYRDRGHCLINSGHHAEAAADYAEAYRLMGDDWDTLYHYALSCYLIGDYKRAEGIYRKVIAQADGDGNRLAGTNWLWASLLHQGKLDEAKALIEAVDYNMAIPEDAIGYYHIVFTAKGKVKPEEVVGDGVQKEVQSITAAYGISNYYRFVLGDEAKADALCEEILSVGQDGMNHPFGYQAASAELARKTATSLTPELDEMIAREPANEYLWHRKIHAYSEARDLEAAVRHASIAMVNVKDPARFLQARGHWFTNLGKYEKSACDFTRAALLRPEDKNILYHYGLSHYLLGEYKRAEKIYLRALDAAASASESISTTNWLWATLVHQGKETQARELLDTVPADLRVDIHTKSGYDRLIMLYKQVLSPEQLSAPQGQEFNLEDSSFLYGLSNYYYFVEKNAAKSDETLDYMIANVPAPFQTSFGYRAALNERERRAKYPV